MNTVVGGAVYRHAHIRTLVFYHAHYLWFNVRITRTSSPRKTKRSLHCAQATTIFSGADLQLVGRGESSKSSISLHACDCDLRDRAISRGRGRYQRLTRHTVVYEMASSHNGVLICSLLLLAASTTVRAQGGCGPFYIYMQHLSLSLII